MDASQILTQLKQERDRIDAAIAALGALGTSMEAPAKRKQGRPAKVSGGTAFNPAELASKRKGKRVLSAEARAKMAEAQKRRWAKVKGRKA
jgi:hypothetical protein